jgi:uncharacterized protein (DUF2252 family)
MSTSQSRQRRRRTPDPVPIAHLTVAERVERGRAARKAVPRSRHAEFSPGPSRPDPIELLERQATTRLPELVPIRHGRMLVSAFTYFRGAALAMASDLSTTPTSGLRVQLCGDAHLSNFGLFGTPERRMVFDINDFDETASGPWEWDLKRLAASLEIAARDNGFTAAEANRIVRDCAAAYRVSMLQFAASANLEVFYASFDADRALAEYDAAVDRTALRRAQHEIAKARTRDSMQAFEKMTHLEDGEPRITAHPPLVVPARDIMRPEHAALLEDWMRGNIRRYRATLQNDRRVILEKFKVVEIARKVVGVGSVGTRAWIVLLLGRDSGDPLFLQVKEAEASVLEEFSGRSLYANHGHRVVAGQRLMQAASDVFLGWLRVTGIDQVKRDFYVRQLRDWKGSIEIDELEPEGMRLYGTWCAWTLARAHACTGDRIAIAAYLGKRTVFDRAIADFAVAYAQQTAHDHAALADAVADGRIAAETGV